MCSTIRLDGAVNMWQHWLYYVVIIYVWAQGLNCQETPPGMAISWRFATHALPVYPSTSSFNYLIIHSSCLRPRRAGTYPCVNTSRKAIIKQSSRCHSLISSRFDLRICWTRFLFQSDKEFEQIWWSKLRTEMYPSEPSSTSASIGKKACAPSPIQFGSMFRVPSPEAFLKSLHNWGSSILWCHLSLDSLDFNWGSWKQQGSDKLGNLWTYGNLL